MESKNWCCLIKLRDNDNVVYMQTTIELNDQMTIKDLKNKLKPLFSIEIDEQEIFHDENRIDSQLELKLESIGKFNELTLKHIRLRNYYALMERKTRAEKLKDEKLIVEAVKLAMPQYELLTKSNFFLSYPEFETVAWDFYEKFAHYLDTDIEYIKCTVRAHFNHLFPTATEISFEQKTKGVSIGTICSVKEGEKLLGQYYIKSHYNLHKSSAKCHAEVDLRELFMYKLLENIKVGPPVYFILNTHHSKYGLFIATKAVNGFIEKSNPKFKRKSEFDLKLQLLKHIFELSDLTSNSNNYGADEDGNLMIVDFMISRHIQGMNSYLNKNKSKLLNYSEILKSWNLQKAETIVDDEIKKEKKISNMKGVTNKSTNDYNVYVDRIKQNIEIAIFKTDQQSNQSEELSPNPKKIKLQNPGSD